MWAPEMGLTAGRAQHSTFAPYLLSCPLTLLLPQAQESRPQGKAKIYFRERICMQNSYALASGASESPDQRSQNTCFRNNHSVKTSAISQRPVLKVRAGVAAPAHHPSTLNLRPAWFTQWPRSSRGVVFRCCWCCPAPHLNPEYMGTFSLCKFRGLYIPRGFDKELKIQNN